MSSHRRKKWRVYQLLVAAGLVKSKTEAANFARSGKILVNGANMESLHYQVDPFKDDVRLNGVRVALKDNRRYFVLNKPQGVETTKENILRFIKSKQIVSAADLNSFTPIGRLDKDTTGLLIITNEGKLGRKVLDPKSKRYKTYRAVVHGRVSDVELQKLRDGVTIQVDEKPYVTLPAQVRVVATRPLETEIEIRICEGKKRQVRQMCSVVGHDVSDLTRVGIAKLELGDLKPGEIREYDKESIYRLLFE